MKKLMLLLATVFSFIPGVSALTESTNYYTYPKGAEVNFYYNAEVEAARANAGVAGIVLEDKGTSEKYVKLILTGGARSSINIGGAFDDLDADQTSLVGSQNWKAYIGWLNAEGYETDYFANLGTDASEKYVTTFPTLDEILNLFGVAKVDGATTYQLPNKDLPSSASKTKTLYESFKRGAHAFSSQSSKKGFFLDTVVGDNIWVVEWTLDAEENISNMELKMVPKKGNSDYGFLGAVYMNKTADCHQPTVDSACYVCDGQYTWAVKGSLPNTCTLIPNVPKAEDCVPKACYKCDGTYKWYKEGQQEPTCEKITEITTEADCVVPPETGLQSHLIEFGIVAALCGLALLVVKRKDLFRTI